MNLWYISSLIIIGLGIVILVVCFLGSIFAIRKISNVLNATLQRIQLHQMQPLQTQVSALTATANRLILDVELKKSDIVEVTDSFKDVVRNVNQLSISSHVSAKQIVDKVNNDPQKQAQTEQWTNIAMGYLKRKS
jgi:uncharacterized protein YoxC